MTASPHAIAPFVRFASVLRSAHFGIAPEQTIAFLAAVDLLGPRGMADIRRAAHATLAPPPERHAEFDALFDMNFLGVGGLDPSSGKVPDDGEIDVHDDSHRGGAPPVEAGEDISGQTATSMERLTARRLSALDETDMLRQFAHALPSRLPLRRGRRLMAARHGRLPDLRRSLREAVRNDGDVVKLRLRRRRLRPRRLLLLIDVSGSMKSRTDAHLRFAHAVTQAMTRGAGEIEVFTLGTRLTRITRAMRQRQREQALEAASDLVADWDGGTRIGDALQAFLAVPRFAGYARGAVALILSDGLERGDPAAMVDAVARLSRLCWLLSWLTPLASSNAFRPQTEALTGILPFIDNLAPGATTAELCSHALGLASRTRS